MAKQLAAWLVVIGVILVSDHVSRGQEHKPDDEGFIRNWLMLAPFPLADDSGAAEQLDKQQIADEGKMRPKEGAGAKIGQNERKWKAIQAKDYYFDFNEILGGMHENVLGYMVCYVVCPEEMK